MLVFYSVRQLARMYRVSSQAVLEWIKYGKVDAIQIGRDWRIFDDGRLMADAVQHFERTRRIRRSA